MAVAIGGAGLPVAFSASLPRCVASHRRLSLVDFELCGNICTRVSSQTVRHPSARLLRRDSPYALAPHQGREAAGNRRLFIVGGWLGCPHNALDAFTASSQEQRGKPRTLCHSGCCE